MASSLSFGFRVFVFIIPFLGFFGRTLAKESFSFINYTRSQGLPTNEVYDMIQGIDGFMYLATDNGLARFNGKEFVTLKTRDGDQPSCSQLSLHSNGSLFTASFDGQIFKVVGDSLFSVFDLRKDGVIPGLFIDEGGRIWVVNTKHLYQIDQHGNILKKVNLSAEIIPGKNERVSIVMENGNQLLLNNLGNLVLYDLKLNSFEAIYDDDGFFRSINLYGKDLLWHSSAYKPDYILDFSWDSTFQLGSQIDFPIELNSGISFTRSKDTYWFNTIKGLVYSTDLIHFDTLFEGLTTSKVIEDSDGQIWISTTSKGVFVIKDPEIRKVSLKEKSLEVFSVEVDKTALWVGYNNGQIERIGPKGSQVFHHPSNKNAFTQLFYRHPIMFAASKGILLLDSLNGPFAYLALGGIKSFEILDSSEFLFGNIQGFATAKAPPSEGDSKSKYLEKLVGDMSVIESYSLPKTYEIHSLKKIRTRAVCRSQEGDYVSFSSGAFLYKEDSFYTLKDQNGNGLTCYDFVEVEEETWAASNTGIHGFKGLEPIWSISSEQGLKDLKVFGLEKQFNLVFAWTNFGLYAIDPTTKEVLYTLNESDGMLYGQVKDVTALDSTLYIGTTQGLYSMNLSHIPVNPVAPKLDIKSIILNGKTLENDEYMVILPFDFGSLELTLEMIALKSGDEAKIKYKLAGRDEDFRFLENGRNKIVLDNLLEGLYELEVIAVNEDGIQSSAIMIPLKVKTPFHRSIWFYLLLIGFFSLLAITIVRLRLRTLRKRFQLQQKIKESELRALQSQMNPHFVFNALNSIQDLVLKSEIRKANKYLVSFSQLMRMVLESSKSGQISLKEELQTLELYLQLEGLRFGKDFQWQINSQVNEDQAYQIQVPSMIIQPHVENAVIHGLFHKKADRRLDIEVSTVNEKLQIKIEDNGVGRKRSREIAKRNVKKHNSYSTIANEKRLDLLNQSSHEKIDLKIDDLEVDGMPTGTRVTLSFPL